MKLNKSNLIGIITGAIIILLSSILFALKFINAGLFYFILGVSAIVVGLPFFMNLLIESRAERNKEQMFLEFTRDLVEGVKSGTPISKSIINVKNKDYGSLNKNIDKLANQISLGIPVKDALETFAKDLGSVVISRSVGLIKEAEMSGGRIESILESVSFSVGQIEKLKKERRAAIYNLTVQGYIIFFIFIIIMLVMQFKILPIASKLDIGTDVNIAGFGNLGAKIDIESISNSFLFLLLSQGFFVGLVIGKISEGSIKNGLKHSFILVAVAWLIATGARAFIGGAA